MHIQWTPTGLTSAVLGDDSAKFTIVVEQLGGESLLQSEPLAGGLNPALFPRGNVGGQFVFRSSQTYGSYQATFNQFIQEYARLNQQGVILVTEGTQVVIMANAVLKGVARIWDAQNSGARMGIRYTFTITTVTSS